MKTLQLQLTDAQLARLETIAGLTKTTPEILAIASVFAELDSWTAWPEFAEGLEDSLCLYTMDPRNESSKDAGDRLEDMAPARLKQLPCSILASPDSIPFELTAAELDVACETLLYELRMEWDDSEEDYIKAVSAWRAEFAPTFVDENQRRLGGPGSLDFTREEAQQFLDRQSQVADLLEKLAKQLPAEEVACE